MSTYTVDALIRDLELVKQRHGGDCDVFIELMQYRGGNLKYNLSEVLQFDPNVEVTADHTCVGTECTCKVNEEGSTLSNGDCLVCDCEGCEAEADDDMQPVTCWLVMGEQARDLYSTPNWEDVDDKVPSMS